MQRTLWIPALCALIALGCATSSATKPEPAGPRTLFDRLGGLPALEAVVDGLLARVSQDPILKPRFALAHLPRLRQRLIEQLCAGTGGGCTYTGRDMKEVHRGMAIRSGEFDALAGHLVATLDALKVPAAEKAEVLAIVGPMKADIVEEP